MFSLFLVIKHIIGNDTVSETGSKPFDIGIFKYLERTDGMFKIGRFGQGNCNDGAELFDTLQFALEESRRVLITYKTHDAKTAFELKFEPQGMLFHSGSLYILGRIVEGKNTETIIKQLKLERIKTLELTDEKFEPLPNFELDRRLDSQFGMFSDNTAQEKQEIRIRFRSFYAQSIREKFWHSSQRFIEQDDGSVILEMDLVGLSSVIRWILGFGRHAEVLSPSELRQAVLEELNMTASQYEGD